MSLVDPCADDSGIRSHVTQCRNRSLVLLLPTFVYLKEIVNISFQATKLNKTNGYVTMKSATDLITVADDFVSKSKQKLTIIII